MRRLAPKNTSFAPINQLPFMRRRPYASL